MKTLRQLWQDAQGLLAEMSVTQRVAVTCLMITVALVLTFAAYLGTTSEEKGVAVLPFDIDPTEQQEVVQRLSAYKAVYNLDARRVVVPVEHEQDALLALASDGFADRILPDGFADALAKWSFTDTRMLSKERMLLARGVELGNLIARFEPIAEARVVYSDQESRYLFTEPFRKSAAVQVKTKIGRKLTDELANTIIHLVAGAKSGLDAKNVVVTDQHGNRFTAQDDNSAGTLAVKKWQAERDADERARRLIEPAVRAMIPNIQFGGDVIAIVRHDINMDAEQIRETVLDGGVKTRTIKDSREQRSISRPPGEPGVTTNALTLRGSDTIRSAYFTETTLSEKRSDDTLTPNKLERSKHVAPGGFDNVTASVIIQMPFELDPDENGAFVPDVDETGKALVNPETLQPYWRRKAVPLMGEDQLNRIRVIIANALRIPVEDAADRVAIQQVPWTRPALSPVPETGARLASLWGLLPVIAIIFLAVIVFFFVIWQVKRPVPTEIEAEVEGPTLTLALKPEPDPVDEAAIEFANLRQKIADAINENPDRAAAQVRRWINKD